MRPVYEPTGRAKEYGDLCVNVYTGCPHRCSYCFAPSVLRRDRETFHANVAPRVGIAEAVKRQIEKERITGKLIHLCFTCDPYPSGCDTTATREVIQAIKAAGNNVQILTKGAEMRDFDLLTGSDWFGVTLTGAKKEQETGAASARSRLLALAAAANRGIKTWVSFEPVIDAQSVLATIAAHGAIFDKVKIGKLNYHPSEIKWAEFGRSVEARCREQGIDYHIKTDLRREMEKGKI
jgi:DNA repair photolyase